jgi:hypothetical protein
MAVNRDHMRRSLQAMIDRHPGSPEAATAARLLKAFVTDETAPAAPAATGVYDRPEAFGLVLLGTVEWIDEKWEYDTSLVFADRAGQLFHSQVRGEYDDIYDTWEGSEMSWLDRMDGVAALEAALRTALAEVSQFDNPNPGAWADAEAVLGQARLVGHALTAA